LRSAFNIVPGAKADVSQPSKGLTESSNIPSRSAHHDNSGATAAAGAGAAGAAALGAGAAAHHHGSSGVGSSGVGSTGYGSSGVGSSGVGSTGYGSSANQTSVPSSTAAAIPTSSHTHGTHGQGVSSSQGLTSDYSQGAVTGGAFLVLDHPSASDRESQAV
jgi:hypothetical protein